MDNILTVNGLPDVIDYGSTIDINTSSVSYATHNFHKYPGKFIPQIPKWAIENYLQEGNTDQYVLDPFCGSGTSLVESRIYGVDAYGFDIDSLSCLMSKVKATPINIKVFEEIGEYIFSNLDIKPTFTPETDNISHWFIDDAINKLSILRTLIDRILDEFNYVDGIEDYYDAYIVLFSSIIRRVSNADNQSQKTYVSGTKIKKPAEVFSEFEKQYKKYTKGFKELKNLINKESDIKVFRTNGDPDDGFNSLTNEIDLIVTSPPYIKSIDYVYNQMAELFWIGDLFDMDTQPRQNKRRREYLGTTMVYKKQYGDFEINSEFENNQLYVETIEKVLADEKNGLKHAYIIQNYFEFMAEHFVHSYDHLKSEGHYIMAIGNSSISGIKIETADLLAELAIKCGFELENRWSYIIKNHFMNFNRKNRGGKITEDHMLILKK